MKTKYKLKLTGGGMNSSTKYYKTAECVKDAFEKALEPNEFGMKRTRAEIWVYDMLNQWLPVETKFVSGESIEWVEFDFNFELELESGEILEVSETASDLWSARYNLFTQYQFDGVESLDYVGWSS